METKELLKLFKIRFKATPSGIEKVPGAGSGRRYWRIGCGASGCVSGPGESTMSVMATYGDDVAENEAFAGLAGVFRSYPELENHIPEVYIMSEDGHAYLQSDCGDYSLFRLINDAKGDEAKERLLREKLKESISLLVKLQSLPREVWEGAAGFRPFSKRLVSWDLNYFKYSFLKSAGVMFDEDALEDDFELFAADLMDYTRGCEGFMYRDFQSRNIMLAPTAESGAKEGKPDIEASRPVFIDFQGGRRGPVVYDIVSLLWQAKAGFSSTLKRELTEYYFSLAEAAGVYDMPKMRESLPAYQLFRTLQVLGAYGFRGLVEHKSHFIESIAGGLRNLKEILDGNPALETRYKGIGRCCRALLADRRFGERVSDGRLRIEVFSFSYKKGYPEDLSGNGGGFMFDCRGMHNPGRYKEYVSLTGRDREVIDFLESRGEVQGFLSSACELVDKTVSVYLRRGFSNLQVGFGCTGGRHRSVYCAEHMAAHLAERFPEARIILRHREQGIECEVQTNFNK